MVFGGSTTHNLHLWSFGGPVTFFVGTCNPEWDKFEVPTTQILSTFWSCDHCCCLCLLTPNNDTCDHCFQATHTVQQARVVYLSHGAVTHCPVLSFGIDTGGTPPSGIPMLNLHIYIPCQGNWQTWPPPWSNMAAPVVVSAAPCGKYWKYITMQHGCPHDPIYIFGAPIVISAALCSKCWNQPTD